jgi:hypothetical protein
MRIDEIGTEGLQFRLEGPFCVEYKMLLDPRCKPGPGLYHSFLFKAFQGSLIFRIKLQWLRLWSSSIGLEENSFIFKDLWLIVGCWRWHEDAGYFFFWPGLCLYIISVEGIARTIYFSTRAPVLQSYFSIFSWNAIYCSIDELNIGSTSSNNALIWFLGRY